MNKLNAMSCEACVSIDNTVTQDEQLAYLQQLPEWKTVMHEGVYTLERSYAFDNFALAWNFTDAIAALAEDEGHHPEITLAWGSVRVRWWTHAVNGLHKNDFICAAKTDAFFMP